MDEVFGIFPTPFMRAPGTLGQTLIAGLVEYFSERTTRDNNSSANLSHTEMLRPSDSGLLREAAALITPKLVEFGLHLFGERLPWALKEMWGNVLANGGRQAMHNHANSFISGIVYLTPTHPGSQTVFMKSPGGSEFLFRNDHQGITPSEFSADKWIGPAPQPGDMVLFPSYLMHAVPPNQGERRMTLSFNSIPSHLKSWDYVIRFGG
ncbi:MAG TPA: TIGR02466 family protein [Polyangiaceae bacterium]|nr:TIGR02466 family protein [Polyangiaceae bacterium]